MWQQREYWKNAKERWYHRRVNLYLIDMTTPLLGHKRYEYLSKVYDHIIYREQLPLDETQRHNLLDTITLVFLCKENYSPIHTSVLGDIRYLLNKHIPIVCKYDDTPEGVLRAVTRRNNGYIPVIHPFTYTMDTSRSLIVL